MYRIIDGGALVVFSGNLPLNTHFFFFPLPFSKLALATDRNKALIAMEMEKSTHVITAGCALE